MPDISISYKGNTILSTSTSGTCTLDTAGTYCEDDITIDYVKPSPTPTQTKYINITQNGTTTEDVANYGTAEISVNVSGGGGGSGNSPVASATIGQVSTSGGVATFSVPLSRTITKGAILIEPDSTTLSSIYGQTTTSYYIVSIATFYPVEFATNGSTSIFSNGCIIVYRGSTAGYATRVIGGSNAFNVAISGTTATFSIATGNGLFFPSGTYNIKIWEISDS